MARQVTACSAENVLILGGLVFVAIAAGSLGVGLVAGSAGDWPGWRKALVGIEATLAALLTLGVGMAWTGIWSAPVASETSIRLWVAGHAVAAGSWLGALLPPALFLRGAGSPGHGALERVLGRVRGIALILLAVVAVTGVAAARTLDGLPALVGTRYGRFLLAQAALFACALGLTVVTSARSRSRPEGIDRPAPVRRLARLFAAQVIVGSAMVIVAVMLTGLASVAEPTMWPFRSRLAPGTMLRFPSVRDQVFAGGGILVAGLLAAIGAYRTKVWRPLLLALAAFLLGTGLYQTLTPMTIDAYPTTYARPAVASTAESIRGGRALFAAHCAPCHGPAGRGDGPAGAGLLQRPADLTASHTADHTAGDLFWWITHGLGLAMPAFGDRLSVTERWDLVNFLRTLVAPGAPGWVSPAGRPALKAGPSPLVTSWGETYTRP